MKLFISTLLLFFLFATPDLATVRKNYMNAANSEQSAKDFKELLSDVPTDGDKTLVSYKAASLILSSKFEKKIRDKMDVFKEGALLLEKMVAANPDAIEIRLIRLSIQENVPSITKYKKNITEDKKYITLHYSEQNNSMKVYINDFVQQSKSFTEAEKKQFK